METPACVLLRIFFVVNFFLLQQIFVCLNFKGKINTKTGQLCSNFIVHGIRSRPVVSCTNSKSYSSDHHTTHSNDGACARLQMSDRYQMRRQKKILFIMESMFYACDLLRRLKELKNRSQLIDKTGSLSTHHGNSLLTDFHLTLHVST